MNFLDKMYSQIINEEETFSKSFSGREKTPEKISKLLLYLSDSDRFSFKMLAEYTDYHKDDSMPTMGVMVQSKRIQFFYNTQFLESLTDDELRFILHHEMLHIILAHQIREKTSGSNTARDHKLFNIAADSIINQMCTSHQIFSQPEVMPKQGYLIRTENPEYASTEKLWQRNPEDNYEGSEITEALYAWMKMRDKEVEKKEKGGDGGEPKFGKVVYNKETRQYGKVVSEPANGKIHVEPITEDEAERMLGEAA